MLEKRTKVKNARLMCKGLVKTVAEFAIFPTTIYVAH